MAQVFLGGDLMNVLHLESMRTIPKKITALSHVAKVDYVLTTNIRILVPALTDLHLVYVVVRVWLR